MCRNIRVLHHFAPPTTPEEIRAAALQYVRKVSGMREDARGVDATFARAIDEIVDATTALLGALPARGEARTREGEREKAKAKWAARELRIAGGAIGTAAKANVKVIAKAKARRR